MMWRREVESANFQEVLSNLSQIGTEKPGNVPSVPYFPMTIVELASMRYVGTATGCREAGNIVVMSNVSINNVVAHGIGHSFGLWHFDAGVPFGPGGYYNLMCTGALVGECPEHPEDLGAELTPDQWATAVKSAEKWK